MLIAQMPSLYHCTRYNFPNICRNIEHIFFSEHHVISLWGYFEKKVTLDPAVGTQVLRGKYIIWPVSQNLLGVGC